MEAGWLLLAILAPLWLSLWTRQLFELPKVVLVRSLAGLFAAAATLTFLRSGAPRLSLHSIRCTPLFWPVIVLAGVLILTTATAVQPDLSLWGSYERGQGLMTQLTYLLLFLLLVTRLRTLAQARRLVTALVLPGALLVLLGAVQALGWQPLPLVTDARSPIYATLGRSNFLGAYLALLLPLTLALLLTSRHKWQRMLLSGLFLGILACLGMTLVRSAWLAACVGLSLFALLWWGMELSALWRRIAWSGVGLLILAGPLTVIGLAQAERGSTAARLAIWQSTLELIRQRPFLGYGPDSLFLVFPRVFPPELVYYQGRQFFIDRAHNWLLDWTVSTGLLGLLAFLFVLATFIVIALRTSRQATTPEKRALLAGAMAAVVANLTNNLVSFDATATATATWLLMGLAVAPWAGLRQATDATIPQRVTASARAQPVLSLSKRSFRLQAIVVLFVVVVAGGTLVANGRLFLADVAARQADQQALAGRWDLATNASQQAIAYWPLEPSYYADLAHHRWQQARLRPEESSSRLQQAEAALLTARALRPQDAGVWAELAEFYAATAREFAADVRPLAHRAFRQAATLAPNHATVFVAWGRLYLEEGDYEHAAARLREAVRLDASYGPAYILLGEAELGLGHVEVAIADYREAVRLDPASSTAHAGLARTYWLGGQPTAARLSLTHALELDPNNVVAQALLQQMQ